MGLLSLGRRSPLFTGPPRGCRSGTTGVSECSSTGAHGPGLRSAASGKSRGTPGQGQLFADAYAQPDAAASAPVFWTEPTRPVRPDDQSPFSANADPADPSAGDSPADAPESA